MQKEKTVFYMKWMNRTRYKLKNGRLDIKHTGSVGSEKEAYQKFEEHTKNGYAVQLLKAQVRQIKTADGREVNLWSPGVVLKENDRWIARQKEREIARLKTKISDVEIQLARLKYQLSEMEG
jgi:hypothetical protein